MCRGWCGDSDKCELGYDLELRRNAFGLSTGYPGEPCPKPTTYKELLDAPRKWELPPRTVKKDDANKETDFGKENKVKIKKRNRKEEEEAKKEDKRREHAYWFTTEYEFASCSACGTSMFMGWNSSKEADEKIKMMHETYKFCPFCGAEMESYEEWEKETS